MSDIKLPALSQSSLQDYADCPRRYQLRYLEKLQYPAAESEPILENERHQQEGAYFHRLIHAHMIGIPVEKLSPLANTQNLSRWFHNYLSANLGIDGFSKHAEFALSAPIGEHRLIAKYDLVAVKVGGQGSESTQALIFDWKTYRRRPREAWLASRLQTRVYPALLVKSGAHLNRGIQFEAEQVEMVYWFADFPSEPFRFKYNAASYTRDWDALSSLAGEIRAASQFPKTEDRAKCSYCPYRSYCDRGVQASAFDAIETELESEEFFDVNFEQIGEIAF